MARWGGCSKREASGKGGRTPHLVVVAALVLSLLLSMSVVAVGCGGDSGPEASVEKFLTAMADQDVDALIEVMATPEDLSNLDDMAEALGMTVDEAKSEMAEDVFSELAMFEELSFSDLTMESQVDGDEAVVTITGGSMNVVTGGLDATFDLTDAESVGFPTTFNLYKVDGKWYMDIEG